MLQPLVFLTLNSWLILTAIPNQILVHLVLEFLTKIRLLKSKKVKLLNRVDVSINSIGLMTDLLIYRNIGDKKVETMQVCDPIFSFSIHWNYYNIYYCGKTGYAMSSLLDVYYNLNKIRFTFLVIGSLCINTGVWLLMNYKSGRFVALTWDG